LKIDINFDFRNDVPINKDPDIFSQKLRQYHKILWSKNLPSGELFDLTDTITGKYLFHQSSLGEFSLSSDNISHSYIFVKRFKSITSQLNDKQQEEILRLFSTIGAYIIFPSNKIDNKITINGARGFYRSIIDRFDLTLECIRRHYLSEESPLSDVFHRYQSFFSLFKNFKGYVDFFLLQDLVNSDYQQVNFFYKFDQNFPSDPFPESFDEYLIFIQKMKDFVTNRSLRMLDSQKNYV